MKRTVVLIAGLLFIAAGAGLFAAGQREGQPSANAGGAPGTSSTLQPGGATTPQSPSPGYGPWGSTLGKQQTITGKVSLAGEFHPLLTSGGTTYELLVPRFLAFEAGVKDGQTITVTGNAVEGQLPPGARFTQQSGTTPLWLSSVTVGGKSYDLATARYQGRGPGWGYHHGFGGRGWGYGPMMGYGPGWGRGYGPGYGPMMGYGPGYGAMMGFGPGYGPRWQHGPQGPYGPQRDWDDR